MDELTKGLEGVALEEVSEGLFGGVEILCDLDSAEESVEFSFTGTVDVVGGAATVCGEECGLDVVVVAAAVAEMVEGRVGDYGDQHGRLLFEDVEQELETWAKGTHVDYVGRGAQLAGESKCFLFGGEEFCVHVTG